MPPPPPVTITDVSATTRGPYPRLPPTGPWHRYCVRTVWGSLGRKAQVTLLLVLAAALSAGALLVLAAFAGWSEVVDSLGLPDRGWFAVAVACEAAAFLGYVLAYRGVAHVEGGPGIGWK